MRLVLLAALIATPAVAAPAVSAAELRATIEKLVGFGTRHTASDTTSPTRGIGAARAYAAARFAEISARCGNCLTIEQPSTTVTAPRLPKPTVVANVLAVQRGTSDPDRVVIISAHIDSRNSDPLDASSSSAAAATTAPHRAAAPPSPLRIPAA